MLVHIIGACAWAFVGGTNLGLSIAGWARRNFMWVNFLLFALSVVMTVLQVMKAVAP